jgi:hypothetical protein
VHRSAAADGNAKALHQVPALLVATEPDGGKADRKARCGSPVIIETWVRQR